eukprot:780196_1
MLVCRLIPSICSHASPVLLQTLFVSILYSFNLLWINDEHRDSLDIICGYSFAQSLFIAIGVSLFISVTKPLHELTLSALSHGDFSRVGVFLQRSFVITHLVFIPIALLFYWSYPVLSFILTSLNTTATPPIIRITSNSLQTLLIGAYSLCIYYNIQTWLFAQNLVRYALCCIVGFGVFIQYFVLDLFDNMRHDLYTDDVAALSITFCVQCVVITSLFVLYCCGCYQSSLRSKIYSVAQRQSTHWTQYTEDKPSKYLLDNTGHNAPMIYSTGSIHTIHSSSSSSCAYNTFTSPLCTPDWWGDSHSVRSVPPWFHLPTWGGWNFGLMFNRHGMQQMTQYAIKQIFIHSLHEFVIYLMLILVPSILNTHAFVSQLLTYNMMNLIIAIPISLSYALHQLMIQKLDKRIANINDVWDTVLCLWLCIISVLIILIYGCDVCTNYIIHLYLPMPNDSTGVDNVRIYLKNVSMPWMCLFEILYGLIIINHAVFKCISSEVSAYGALNTFVFLIIGLPLCCWLLSTDHDIPKLLSSLHGIWFSVCLCCALILSYAVYKRCVVDWKRESTLYLQRKLIQKRQYRYDIQLQTRGSGNKTNGNRKTDIYNHDSEYNAMREHTSPTASIAVQHNTKHKRLLRQLRSWSDMDANPYRESDFDSTVDTKKTEDTAELMLKTDSEEENEDEYDVLQQYGDGLDTLDDGSEASSSVVADTNRMLYSGRMTVLRVMAHTQSIPSKHDDGNSITTMDSIEARQMLNDLESDSSSV